jgi:methionyl-tRNA formyltransferase
MFGSDAVSLEVLKEIFKNYDDNNGKIIALEVVSGRRYSEFAGSEFEKWAKDHGLRVHHFQKHDGKKLITNPFPEPGLLVKGGFDLAVVASFPHRLPDSYLSQFPLGALNMHPSLLPQYRGPAPIYRAMLDGQTETGISIATVEKTIDTGKILLREPFSIPPDTKYENVMRTMAWKGAKLMRRAVENYDELLASAKDQQYYIDNGEEATYAAKVSQTELRWKEMTTAEIHKLFLVLGHIGLYTYLTRTKGRIRQIRFEDILKIDPEKVSSTVDLTTAVPPGTIKYDKGNRMLLVRCADGWIGTTKRLWRIMAFLELTSLRMDTF